MTSNPTIAAGDDMPAEPVALSVAATETFESFYRRELPHLVTLAAALAGAAVADDIAQEAMLAAYRRWDIVSRLDLPAGWVRRVCANHAVSSLRRRAAPTFVVPNGMAGASRVFLGNYTLADQANGGVTVVWSWHYGLDRPSLSGNDAFVDDLLTP